ncbi:filamentous hemagglutinin [Colletotrichum tofieldiae]|uniref:Filamentous hemagglutinin n=1 Tax=Colletotrichum tofieldiae TaxID=708197 RepID=A0A161YHI5_9PEZI|nr:filamentous hemagglutinin [Colletotrichum tofieldiae]GKT58553.1 filamentous hemagglutinin [Colletotrichum tofieldiae]GKT78030.1 filamentous hemagglutinin [Colletotrichum tofieldiae]
MRYIFFALTALLARACAAPQDPQVPISTSVTTLTVTGQPVPVPTEPIPNNPDPLPAPAPSAPVPADPSQPAPPAGGPHCVCGATYCGKVLVGFQGYSTEQVGQGYCSTPGTDCASAAPAPESLQDNLFVCVCPAGQKEGSAIELLCTCQGRCKNDKPDFIGRCETPCNLGCASAAPVSSSAPVPLPVPVPVEPAPIPNEPVPAPAPPVKRRA